MAVKPVEVHLNNLLGVNTIDDDEMLNADMDQEGGVWCTSIINTNLDRKGGPHRRDGYTTALSGTFKNLWHSADRRIVLGLRNLSDIVRITYNGSWGYSTILAGVGSKDIVFQQIANSNIIYYTNEAVFGKLVDLVPTTPSTDTEYKRVMPAGHMLEYYKGRLYVAVDNLILYSDVAFNDRYDVRNDKAFLRLGSKVTLMKAVQDGLFIADGESTYFFGGAPYDKDAGTRFAVKRLADYGAIAGTAEYEQDVPFKGNKIPEVVGWESTEGTCFGFQGGEFINVTRERTTNPVASKGAGVFIIRNQFRRYISNIQG